MESAIPIPALCFRIVRNAAKYALRHLHQPLQLQEPAPPALETQTVSPIFAIPTTKVCYASDKCKAVNKIDRLLCCTASVAKSIALGCYDDVASLQVLAIHNTDTYGGGGGEIASVTTNYYSSIVGVHEVGHSLFG